VIVYDDLMADLIEGKKLKIKHGVDPTKRSLTLGHAVNYEKLRQFQQRGHEIQFLIGSFTAMFGDPTDKSESRSMRSKQEVMDMAKSYIEQVTMILDEAKLKIFYNDKWYSKMPIEEFLQLLSSTTVARMLERDMFQKRIEDGREIGLHELIYPILQGYDSVEMKSNLTVIGTDQTFNELQARPLQKDRGLEPQNILSMEMLVGTDGKLLMSQSQGNYIAMDDTAEDKFGKLMSIPDHLIEKYVNALSRYSRKELQALLSRLDAGENPRNVKMDLAEHIVTNFNGEQAAKKAREGFKEVFQNKGLPNDIPKFVAKPEHTILEILQLSSLVTSGSQARRLISQGAVKVYEGDKILDISMTFKVGQQLVLQVGKLKFLDLTIE
jgi:tyrosyl-tRNA synthetase